MKSPSPDSGIHDFHETTCSSPISVMSEPVTDQGADYGYMNDVQRERIPHMIDQIEIPDQTGTPDSGIGLRAGSVTSSESGGSEDLGTVTEKADIPRRHNLDKVLFSLSSYTERQVEPQKMQRSDSFNRQLSESLERGHFKQKTEDNNEVAKSSHNAKTDLEFRGID